jgi:DNA-binding NarL/FixJ family response regulator
MQQSTIEDIMKVVIVDDSVEIQERLLTMLRDIPGIEIAGQATTVAEALSTVRQLRPDVMILDLRLPDGNGLEVLRITQREQIQTRVIILTNYVYPQYEQRARAAGAYAFLNKAKEFGRVADLVRSLLPGSGKTPKEPPALQSADLPGVRARAPAATARSE